MFKPRYQALTRRTLGLLCASLLCANALAQSAYPNKVVKFINNWPAGGPSDIIARSMANELQKTLKQAMVVENKPGAAGNIGADQVAKAPADGYSVLFTIDTPLTVNPHLYKNMGFKLADLKPIMVIAASGLLVGVNPGTGFKPLPDLINAGKSKSLNFSSAGSGSPGHLAVQVFRDATGMQVMQIPYKGNSPAVTAILGGEVDGGVLATPGMLPHVQAGKIIPLAVTSSRRSSLLPNVPTVAEAGYKGLEQEVLYLAMVPAATPDDVVQTLQKAMLAAAQTPEMKQRLAGLDLFYEGLTGADASKRLADLSARYAKVIQATGMKVE